MTPTAYHQPHKIVDAVPPATSRPAPTNHDRRPTPAVRPGGAFRRVGPSETRSLAGLRQKTGPGSYPDRTHTGRRQRAYNPR